MAFGDNIIKEGSVIHKTYKQGGRVELVGDRKTSVANAASVQTPVNVGSPVTVEISPEYQAQNNPSSVKKDSGPSIWKFLRNVGRLGENIWNGAKSVANTIAGAIDNAYDAIAGLFTKTDNLAQTMKEIDDLKTQLAANPEQKTAIEQQISEKETLMKNQRTSLVDYLSSFHNDELTRLAEGIRDAGSNATLKGLLDEVRSKNYSVQIQQKFGRLSAFTEIEISRSQEQQLSQAEDRLQADPSDETAKDMIRTIAADIKNALAVNETITQLANGDQQTLDLVQYAQAKQQTLTAKIAVLDSKYKLGINSATQPKEEGSGIASAETGQGQARIIKNPLWDVVRFSMEDLKNFNEESLKGANDVAEGRKRDEIDAQKKVALRVMITKLQIKRAEQDLELAQFSGNIQDIKKANANIINPDTSAHIS